MNDGEEKEIFIKPGAPEGSYTMELTLVDDNVDDPKETLYTFSI